MTDSKTITLKELAYNAIAKHSRRIFKHEAGVLLDKDPEDLHQMRVGMRRLRSATAGFDLAIDLPNIFTSKNIAKIGHSLGKLRDLDVLLDVLANNYRSHPRQFLQRGEPPFGFNSLLNAGNPRNATVSPQWTVSQLSSKEQKSLDRVLKSLEKQRKREVDRVRKTLDSKLYLNLKQGLN
jgi:CHAD domain-containing protein